MNAQTILRPVAKPQVIENAFSEDQYRRMLEVVRREGPYSCILAQHFSSPQEVVASLAGQLPEGVEPTWDMFLTPVFRGYFAKGSTALHPEIEDCFLNRKFLDLVRGYWGAAYARPDNMLFNLQGPCRGGDAAHIDAARFRGIAMHTTPVWVMNIMVKSGLFTRWKSKKAQVITWYYKGRIGGGFTCWPDGPQEAPWQIKAPMWGRAVVVENEMMYHMAEATGPSELRQPQGLAFHSRLQADPAGDGWQITTGDDVIQQIAADEMRFLIHWGADIFMDYQELKVALDHSDDLTHEQVFDIFIHDLRARGEQFAMPTDPIRDPEFVGMLTRVYDPGKPSIYPPEPVEAELAA
jgi:hypothetical protein